MVVVVVAVGVGVGCGGWWQWQGQWAVGSGFRFYSAGFQFYNGLGFLMVGGSLGFLIMVVAMSDLLGVFVWEKRYTQRKR